jgi:hypothetical protein
MLFKLFHQTAPQSVKPLPYFPHIVRDSDTHQIIASGSLAKCRAYIAAFGHCYLDTCY